MLALSATLAAQQNVVMIQVLDGYSGVAIARHQVSIATGTTPAEVTARKNVQNTWTDERGVLMMPLPAGPTGWIQLWIGDMHSCELHPETDSFSLAKIAATGVQTPNKCSHMSVRISPGHFVIYQREFTAAEYAATKESSPAKN
ncbi:MAG TPA: hypothetical protein VNU94_09430 [Acidobacteriaceae bacterium]|nr:hypothetical protein [Acidobacteriaceae bacterium]